MAAGAAVWTTKSACCGGPVRPASALFLFEVRVASVATTCFSPGPAFLSLAHMGRRQRPRRKAVVKEAPRTHALLVLCRTSLAFACDCCANLLAVCQHLMLHGGWWQGWQRVKQSYRRWRQPARKGPVADLSIPKAIMGTEFTCPITRTLLRDPVFLRETITDPHDVPVHSGTGSIVGSVYERSALMGYWTGFEMVAAVQVRHMIECLSTSGKVVISCPITKELMVDTVQAEDMFIYERAAIEGWIYARLEGVRPGSMRVMSPITNRKMGMALRNAVQVLQMIERDVGSGAISRAKAKAWKSERAAVAGKTQAERYNRRKVRGGFYSCKDISAYYHVLVDLHKAGCIEEFDFVWAKTDRVRSSQWYEWLAALHSPGNVWNDAQRAKIDGLKNLVAYALVGHGCSVSPEDVVTTLNDQGCASIMSVWRCWDSLKCHLAAVPRCLLEPWITSRTFSHGPRKRPCHYNNIDNSEEW